MAHRMESAADKIETVLGKKDKQLEEGMRCKLKWKEKGWESGWHGEKCEGITKEDTLELQEQEESTSEFLWDSFHHLFQDAESHIWPTNAPSNPRFWSMWTYNG